MSRLLLAVFLIFSAYVCAQAYRRVEEHEGSNVKDALSLADEATDDGCDEANQDGVSMNTLCWWKRTRRTRKEPKKSEEPEEVKEVKEVKEPEEVKEKECPPLRVVIGNAAFSAIGDRSSCPVRPWTPKQTEDRERSVEVKFGITYVEPPAVFLSLQHLDIDKGYNGRYRLSVSDVTTTGCTIHFNIWCNTYVFSSTVGYQATGYEAV